MCDICLTPVYPALESVSSIFVRGAEQSLLVVGRGRQGTCTVSPPLAEILINMRRQYFSREARSRNSAALLGRTNQGKSVGCFDCAEPQSSLPGDRALRNHPPDASPPDGSVYRGMPSTARRGSLARLPGGKGAGVPQESRFSFRRRDRWPALRQGIEAHLSNSASVTIEKKGSD